MHLHILSPGPVIRNAISQPMSTELKIVNEYEVKELFSGLQLTVNSLEKCLYRGIIDKSESHVAK